MIVIIKDMMVVKREVIVYERMVVVVRWRWWYT
jgi:hypothetical protein